MNFRINAILTRSMAKFGFNNFMHRFNINGLNPLIVTIRVTDNCNLKCNFCNFNITDSLEYMKLGKKGEMSFKTFKKIINEIKGSPLIAITGGEPTLHPQIFKMIKLVKQRGLPCSMVTNGTTLQSFHKKIVDSKLDILICSIDSINKIHDKVRGVPGTFNKVINGLTILKNYSSRPLLIINTAISSDNMLHLYDLVKYLNNKLPEIDMMNIQQLWFKTEEGVKLQNKLYPKLKISHITRFDTHLTPKKIFSQLKKIKSYKSNFYINTYPTFTEKELYNYYSSKNLSRSKHCTLKPRCVWKFIEILSNGDVVVCDEIVVGNVKTENLMDIWNNKYKYIRNVLSKTCLPTCHHCCIAYA